MPPETQSDHHAKCLRFLLHQPLLPSCSKTLVSKQLYNTNSRPMKMKFPRKFAPVFIFLLSSISILRLIKIMLTISSPSPTQASTVHHTYPTPLCSSASKFLNISSWVPESPRHPTALTKKELQFLSRVVASRVPCNLLVFGPPHPQYLSLALKNKGGYTIFLDGNSEKRINVRINSSIAKIYKVKYNTTAADAFKLLRYARENKACKPHQGFVRDSSCKLALTNLPLDVYRLMWDVIVVDGPSGQRPAEPGRMASIYTASMLARATKNSTEVVVHDVDRMIEKWFSWEFLCDENLRSSKGKLWSFTITKNRKSTRFCTERK